jgi:hypothetical protein
MKFVKALKVPVILLGFGAALALSPACKAQAEVAPDNYDNAESLAARQPAPQNLAAAGAKQTPPASQTRNHLSPVRGNLQLAAKNNPARPDAPAAQEGQKAAATEPKKP